MDLILRQEFRDAVESHAEKYGLSNVIYAAFLLQYGFKYKFNASDVVYGMLGLLESVVSGAAVPKTVVQNFSGYIHFIQAVKSK